MATISADLVDGYRVVINNGRHEWTADEPIDLGGSDKGPNPYELLLGALAACTSITVAMYARRKEMQLDSISVRVPRHNDFTDQPFDAGDLGNLELDA